MFYLQLQVTSSTVMQHNYALRENVTGLRTFIIAIKLLAKYADEFEILRLRGRGEGVREYCKVEQEDTCLNLRACRGGIISFPPVPTPLQVLSLLCQVVLQQTGSNYIILGRAHN